MAKETGLRITGAGILYNDQTSDGQKQVELEETSTEPGFEPHHPFKLQIGVSSPDRAADQGVKRCTKGILSARTIDHS